MRRRPRSRLKNLFPDPIPGLTPADTQVPPAMRVRGACRGAILWTTRTTRVHDHAGVNVGCRYGVKFRRRLPFGLIVEARSGGLLCLVLAARNIRFQQPILLPSEFSAGISFIENIDSFFSRQSIVFSMSAIAVPPIPKTRKHQKDESKPQDPAPPKIPIVPIKMIHLMFLGRCSKIIDSV